MSWKKRIPAGGTARVNGWSHELEGGGDGGLHASQQAWTQGRTWEMGLERQGELLIDWMELPISGGGICHSALLPPQLPSHLHPPSPALWETARSQLILSSRGGA